MSACLEIYSCKQDGECRIRDDFQRVRDQVIACDGLMLASPIFYYAVSAHTKILMDRFHSLWVFISAGATRGRRLFDGTLLSVRYFFDTLDMDLWKALLYRGLEHEGEVDAHPDYLNETYHAGRELAEALRTTAAANGERR